MRNLENIQLLVRKGSIAEAKNDINGVIAYLTTHSQTENLLAVEAAQIFECSNFIICESKWYDFSNCRGRTFRCDGHSGLFQKTTGTFSE